MIVKTWAATLRHRPRHKLLQRCDMTYFLTFRARGEVAEMLLLGGEEPRLLVDLSTEPLHGGGTARHHTPRASFTITDPELIRRFLHEVKLGDTAEAEGAFRQGDYIPHRTTCIDTVFTITAFKRISRRKQPDTGRAAITTPDPHVAARHAAPAVLH